MRDFVSKFFLIILSLSSSFAYCQLTPSFDIPSEVCLEENLVIDNTSTDAISFLWDLCPVDLSGNITSSLLIDLDGTANAFGIDIIYDDGSYYGFVTSRDNSLILRLDYGDSISVSNLPTVTQLTPSGDGISSPYDIQIVKQGNNWFGFIGNGNNTISLLEFGTSLTNTSPIATQYGGLGLNLPRGLVVTQEASNWFAIASNFNESKISVIDFGTDLEFPSISVVDHEISEGSQLIGLDIFNSGVSHDVLVVSFDQDKIYRVEIDDLSSSTSIVTEISNESIELNAPNEVQILDQNDSLYVFILNRNSGYSRLVFGESLDDLISGDAPETGGASGFSNTLASIFIKIGVKWYGQTLRFDDGQLFEIKMDENCSGIQFNSSTLVETNPLDIKYLNSGTKEMALFAYDDSENQKWTSQSFEVTVDVAPDVSFSTITNCIAVPNAFTPSLSGLIYSWDFNDDGVEDSNLENPIFDYGALGEGTYTVRLDVDDGTCSNFSEQEITIYPEPPIPAFTPSSTSECANTTITFTNNTDESQHVGVLSYAWDFDNDGTIDSTDPNPTFAYTTSGMKTVSVVSSIPGCESIATQETIEIREGPLSAYTASDFSICEGDVVSFTDQSTGDPVSWAWDFDNGSMSTDTNPEQVFMDAGSYNVSLQTTDASGCQNTLIQEVAVAPLPVGDFDFDILCTSESGIQFMDLSTVDGASIIQRTWYLNDLEVSTEANPFIVFESSGTNNVRLELLASNGCEVTYSEDVIVLSSPTPNFNVEVGCQGEVSTFEDLTESVDNTIVSWLWTIEGTTYNTPDITHTFSDFGSFDVSLEVTGQNFCSEILTQSVEVLQLPTPSITVDGVCSNEFISISNNSTIFNDPVLSTSWTLDEEGVGNGDEIILSDLSSGTHSLSLQLITQSGCEVSLTEDLVINDSPQSDFTYAKNYGVPGEAIIFTESAIGASSFQWLLNDSLISTNTSSQSIQFTDAGNQEVALVVSNDFGCNDTTSTDILIAIPEVDISIGQFELIEDGTTGSIFLEVKNKSNLPIDLTEAVIELENQFTVSEQISSLILAGDSQLVNLSVGIPLGVSEPSYLCVTLNSQYKSYEDINPLDNEKCVSIQPRAIIEAPFPNPCQDDIRVKIITNLSNTAIISLYDSSGKLVFRGIEELTEGLTNIFLDVSALEPGTYYMKASVESSEKIHRLIKF